MKLTKVLFAALISVFALSSCGGSGDPVTAAAQGTCDCLSDMLDKVEGLEGEELMTKMQELSTEGQACGEKVQKVFETATKGMEEDKIAEMKKAVEPKMKELCADATKRLEDMMKSSM